MGERIALELQSDAGRFAVTAARLEPTPRRLLRIVFRPVAGPGGRLDGLPLDSQPRREHSAVTRSQPVEHRDKPALGAGDQIRQERDDDAGTRSDPLQPDRRHALVRDRRKRVIAFLPRARRRRGQGFRFSRSPSTRQAPGKAPAPNRCRSSSGSARALEPPKAGFARERWNRAVRQRPGACRVDTGVSAHCRLGHEPQP